MTLVRIWSFTDYDRGRFYIDNLPSALEHIFDIRLSGIVFSIRILDVLTPFAERRNKGTAP
jgi:hypothetical protein